MKRHELKMISFGFEQTYTIRQWWNDPGFTQTSDSPLKRQKMHELASVLAKNLNGKFMQSTDIWGHIQFEVFDNLQNASFIVTMDPGSIEVKTPPVTFDNVKAMALALTKACEEVDLLPYRNWWYGVKGGTEGGCHINMGGLGPKTNPFIKSPELIIKYCSYLHNRPWLTYPFMGPDVGPQGNAMRLDEKDNFEVVKDKMSRYINLCQQGKSLSAIETYNFFKDTTLVSEKSSAPSLYKFNAPDFLIEDRAQESLRSVSDFELVTNLRLKIFEFLIKEKAPEELIVFSGLHKEMLTSYWLWGKFQYWANDLGLNPVDYQVFFDRQFPKLSMGDAPKLFNLKEGRRPRVITEIQKRGDVVIGKTIDTTFKRFELSYYTEIEEQFDFEIHGQGIEYSSPITRHNGYLGMCERGQAYYKYFDIKYDHSNPIITFILKDKLLGTELEKANFNIHDMQWC